MFDFTHLLHGWKMLNRKNCAQKFWGFLDFFFFSYESHWNSLIFLKVWDVSHNWIVGSKQLVSMFKDGLSQ